MRGVRASTTGLGRQCLGRPFWRVAPRLVACGLLAEENRRTLTNLGAHAEHSIAASHLTAGSVLRPRMTPLW
jgi:hypothetical protein